MTEARRSNGLLGRLARRRHLDDAALLGLIERAASDPHVDSCERCATRHAELLCAFADLEGLHAEADHAFDAERLAHQRAHVLMRIDRNNGPARVLPFPAAAAATALGAIGLAGRRWVAAAAIGGLVVGVFSGRLITHRTAPTSEVAPVTRTATARTAPSAGGLVSADFRGSRPDEVLLEEVEYALSSGHVGELIAIDAITPTAR